MRIAIVGLSIVVGTEARAQNVGWKTSGGAASVGCSELTIQDAVTIAEIMAGAGETITIYPLPIVYVETVSFLLPFTYVLEPGDATCVAAAPGLVTLNPPAGARTVEVANLDAVVTLKSVLHDGLGAAGPSNGGLISVVDGALTLLDNEVRNATASFGGCINVANGILNLGTPGPLSMDGTRVWGCVAGVSGGGILVGDLAQFTPAVLNVGADSTIDGNGAGIAGGGGIAVAPEATANVFDNASVFLNETSGVGGGGVRTSANERFATPESARTLWTGFSWSEEQRGCLRFGM